MDEKEKIIKLFVCVLLSGLVFGCSACSRLYGNIYEGVQMQKRQEAPPNIDAPELHHRKRRRRYPEKLGLRDWADSRN
jgi:hypothetical protein